MGIGECQTTQTLRLRQGTLPELIPELLLAVAEMLVELDNQVVLLRDVPVDIHMGTLPQLAQTEWLSVGSFSLVELLIDQCVTSDFDVVSLSLGVDPNLAVAVATGFQGYLSRRAVLFIFLEVDVDNAFHTSHSLRDGGVDIDVKRLYLTGLCHLQECLVINQHFNIVHCQNEIGAQCLAVDGHRFRTYHQHVHKRHLLVRMQGVHVDDIVVAFIGNRQVVSPCRRVETAQQQDKHPA